MVHLAQLQHFLRLPCLFPLLSISGKESELDPLSSLSSNWPGTASANAWLCLISEMIISRDSTEKALEMFMSSLALARNTLKKPCSLANSCSPFSVCKYSKFDSSNVYIRSSLFTTSTIGIGRPCTFRTSSISCFHSAVSWML